MGLAWPSVDEGGHGVKQWVGDHKIPTLPGVCVLPCPSGLRLGVLARNHWLLICGLRREEGHSQWRGWMGPSGLNVNW